MRDGTIAGHRVKLPPLLPESTPLRWSMRRDSLKYEIRMAEGVEDLL